MSPIERYLKYFKIAIVPKKLMRAYRSAISRKSGLFDKKPTTPIKTTAIVPKAFTAKTLSKSVSLKYSRNNIKIIEISNAIVATKNMLLTHLNICYSLIHFRKTI